MSCSRSCSSSFINTHTDTSTLTSTKYFSILECRHGLWHVNKDIAAVLHQVLLFLTEVALSGSVYLLNGVQRVVGFIRTEVNKGIAQERFVVASLCVTVCIKVGTEVWVLIVIHTVCTTKYLLHAALNIFHIGRSFEHVAVVHLGTYSIVTNTAVEIGRTKDLPAQVVTTIYEVTNVWETVSTDISLGMSEDISITCTCKAIEDTSIT